MIYTAPHHQVVIISQLPTLETAVKLNGRVTVLALILAQPFTQLFKSETLRFEFHNLYSNLVTDKKFRLSSLVFRIGCLDRIQGIIRLVLAIGGLQTSCRECVPRLIFSNRL